MRLKWTRSVLADLKRILDYIAQDDPQVAKALAAGSGKPPIWPAIPSPAAEATWKARVNSCCTATAC